VAHSLSAKKRVRQNEKRRARNRFRKTQIRDIVKGFVTTLATGAVAKSETALNETVSRLDKVAAKNTIHKKAASRKRSRLTLRLNALKSGKAPAAVVAGAKLKAKPKAAKGTKAAKA
jgi:small subunit ribosomal protein S20